MWVATAAGTAARWGGGVPPREVYEVAGQAQNDAEHVPRREQVTDHDGRQDGHDLLDHAKHGHGQRGRENDQLKFGKDQCKDKDP